MRSKSYLYTIVVFLVASYIHIGIIPATANEDDWNSLTATLGHENSEITVSGYTLEALKFDGYGMVLVQVSKNNITLGTVVLEHNSSSWYYMDNENLRFKAYNITDKETLPMFANLCSPEAEVVVETKKPDDDNVNLELDLDADKEEYLLGDEVIIDTELRNTGEVAADKIKFEVNSDGLLIQNKIPENIAIEKGSKKSLELKFKFPETIKEIYNINANVSWEDNSGKHFISKAEEVKVSEPLEIYKNIGSDVFLGSPAYVIVSVKNIQERPVYISLIDLLPATFTMVNYSKSNNSIFGSNNSSYLSQEFVLAAEEMKTFSYYIKSDQLGAHRVPETHAYANLCGQLYIESSDSENIIKVYENISYKEYRNETDAEKIPPVEVKLHVNLAPA